MLLSRLRRVDPARTRQAVEELQLPEAVFKTCPWQPRELIETGLRQWLLCCGAAVRDSQVIGMPSRAVDEAWHGLILCTRRYSRFCRTAYGTFLHHFPEGDGSGGGTGDSMATQLGRTVVAWSMVARPGEECVLWDLDAAVGVEHPWGVPLDRVSAIESALREDNSR